MRANPANVSAYYKKPLFWLVRIAVMVIAGRLAVAEDAAKPLLAVNIGASAAQKRHLNPKLNLGVFFFLLRGLAPYVVAVHAGAAESG